MKLHNMNMKFNISIVMIQNANAYRNEMFYKNEAIIKVNDRPGLTNR